MNDIAFKNGFLCGLLGTGVGIGGSSSSDGKLPEALEIINLSYYENGISYLNDSNYTAILSSSFSYMPSEGYVMIGGFDLYDFEGEDDWSSPEATIRIVVDGATVYEGDVVEYFEDLAIDPPKTFQYSMSFELAAKRRNMSDGMQIELKETMIVGLK